VVLETKCTLCSFYETSWSASLFQTELDSISPTEAVEQITNPKTINRLHSEEPFVRYRDSEHKSELLRPLHAGLAQLNLVL
jgi:hypothetical protein